MSWILKNKRKKAKCLLVCMVLVTIGVINIPLAIAIAICLLATYIVNLRLYKAWWYYIEHPALKNLKRNYDEAMIGSTSCYILKNVNGGGKLNWALPQLSYDDLSQILYRYYTLVREGGLISLYISTEEITLYWDSAKKHPFVYSILHNWTKLEERRCHDWKLLFIDFRYTLALLGFGPKLPISATAIDEKNIERITQLKEFLKERNRKFCVILPKEDFEKYSSLLTAKQINCIQQ